MYPWIPAPCAASHSLAASVGVECPGSICPEHQEDRQPVLGAGSLYSQILPPSIETEAIDKRPLLCGRRAEAVIVTIINTCDNYLVKSAALKPLW